MPVYYPFVRYLDFPTKVGVFNKSSTVASMKLQTRCARASHLFDELPHRNVYSLNSLLSSHSRKGNFVTVWDIFCLMHSAYLELDAYTFTPVLGACSALPGPERGHQVHALMIKTGTDSGTVTKTALMDMYQNYGFLVDSVKVFDEIEFKDVVTWNALLSSFVKHGLAREALGVFAAMRRELMGFSEFTLCSVLKACASLKGFPQGKQVHCLVVVMGQDLVVLGTALIDFYSSVGYITESMKVFFSLSWRKDAVMWNSLIAGCVRNKRYKEAYSVISSLRPNAVALTSALAACSENLDLRIGTQIHCVATRCGFTTDTQLCNVLLDMYAKCGKFLYARLSFDWICDKDVVSWTSMIDACGRHGRGHEAIELFTKMGEVGSRVLPNSVTFLAVLSACGHSGLVEEGRKLFYLAREKYDLDPGVEHYCCFIDILGRAGRIEDVWSLFYDMVRSGTKPTIEVWAAVLNACCVNHDVLRGECAAKQLLGLKPNNPVHYVLLSNFYASIGRWDVVDSLRSKMREKDLMKEAGSSWISVALVHENASYLQIKEAKMDGMIPQLRLEAILKHHFLLGG